MTVAASDRAHLYRSVWRWHFYAGLLVAPFLVILAVTGAIYLFNDELNDALYPQMRFVQPGTSPQLPETLIGNAVKAYPGSHATRMDLPSDPARTALVFLETPEGPVRVYVDPGSGRVLGSIVYTRTLVGMADTIHGSLMIGTLGDRLVELAACWTVVLLVTGLYLWWPRVAQQEGGVWLPRLRAQGRVFWRDVHAMSGLYISGLVLFLVLTGLPWAGVWGSLLTQAANAAGVGYPATYRTHHAPASPTAKQVLGEAPWTLEQAPMPLSGSAAEHASHHGHELAGRPQSPIGVNAAAGAMVRVGLERGYRLVLPEGEHGVYTGYTYPDKPEGQRTIHIDQYSGAVLNDARFADYGPVAKAVELGVAIHMGNYFGRFNQALMLLACVGALALPVTGAIMWWRRRPRGNLGAPPVRSPAQARTVLLITLALALLFPLAGASLLLIFCLDRWIMPKAPRLRRVLS